MQNNTFQGHFTGEQIIVIDELPSTNDYLKKLASNFTPSEEFTAIMAIHQSAGRGQREKTFFSTRGESLTFSFLLYPQQLIPQDVFLLNVIVCLGVQDWLRTYTDNCAIKWPNDLFLHGKKLAGILIENTIQQQHIKQAVIGIGLNVRQQHFPTPLDEQSCSLMQYLPELAEMPIRDLCASLLSAVRLRYLKGFTEATALLEEYNTYLYGKDIEKQFMTSGASFTGRIKHVDREGRLHIERAGESKAYAMQEIRMIR